MTRLQGGWNRECNPGRPPVARALVMALLLVMLATGGVTAKSLYVITQIRNYDGQVPINAYDIDPDGLLTYQAAYGAPFNGSGVVGLAVNSLTDHLFVTYEDSNIILTFNASTFTGPRTNKASNAKNLAGIVYDHSRQLLYVVDRQTTDLYTYSWDPKEEVLIHMMGSPSTLEGAFAYGIALDEINDLLYVGNANREITVYSTWDWRLLQTIPVSRVAISVAVDPTRGYLYYGAGYLFSYFLSQVDLATGVEKEIQIAEDAGVIGLGVDPATGLVYVSTGRDDNLGKRNDGLLVYNAELELMQRISNVGDPTGLVIPGLHTGYNPLNLRKSVKSPSGGHSEFWELPEIIAGDDITYVIRFDRNGYDLQNISIVDRLPKEMEFIGATGDGAFGQYDPNTHTYRWTNPPLATGTTELELTGRLLPQTPLGHIVTNLVTMDTDKTPQTTTGVEAVVSEVSFRPLNISNTVLAAGEATKSVYAVTGSRVTYRICIDNLDNESMATSVSVVDELPREVALVIEAREVDPISGAMGERVGQYDPNAHTYRVSYPSLGAGEFRCFDLIVQLSDSLESGTTVSNYAKVFSAEAPVAGDSADLVIGYLPIDVHKIIVNPLGVPDEMGRLPVEIGRNITYEIRFQNPLESRTVSQVTIVDTLPDLVDFISADGDRDFGFYDANDRTYTWQYYAPLAPGEEIRLQLVGQVRPDIEPNTPISNSVVVTSQETASSSSRVDALAVVALPQPPVEASVLIKPRRLLREEVEPTRELLVTMRLPKGFGRELIADVPLTLYCGDAECGQCISMRIYGTSMQGKVLCFFETAPIFRATQGYGEFPVTVAGRLVDGRPFVGGDTIWIGKGELQP